MKESKTAYLHIRIDEGMKKEIIERVENINKKEPFANATLTSYVTKLAQVDISKELKKNEIVDGMTFKDFYNLVQGNPDDYQFASDIVHEFVLLEGESGTFEDYLYDTYKKCESCGEWFKRDDLVDTIEYINGGCGDYCEGCVEDGDMIAL